MSECCLLHHLGLGDAIICQPIYRWLCAVYNVLHVPCKPHNLVSVTDLVSDLPNCRTYPVEDDNDMLTSTELMKNLDGTLAVFGLGMYGKGPFIGRTFDRSFYQQADVPFEDRWKKWILPKRFQIPKREKQYSGFAFVHSDAGRGFPIRRELVHESNIIHPVPAQNGIGSIFSWLPDIARADSIHCIDSSFALLIDSLDFPEPPFGLHLHRYARPAETIPEYRKAWRMLP